MSKAPKILLWDIEATNLVADYGRILCIGWKWYQAKKTHLIRIRSTEEFKTDRTDDSGVLKAFDPIMMKADLHVFWFGEYFDLPFVQTRRMMSGLQPMAPVPFIDGWKIAKKKLKFRSNRLDAVSKTLPMANEEDREEKLHPKPIDWVRANAGYEDALKIIEDRCVSDVLVLEQCYHALRPFGASLPNLAKFRHPELEGCPSCGDKRVQSRGTVLTVRGKKRRFHCQECGHWFSVPMKVKP